MKRITDLKRLATITDTALSGAQARMHQINSQEAALQQQLAELSRRSTAHTSLDSLAVQAGADVRWQVWADRRREEINLEMARLRAMKEEARHALRKAFGKDQAMQHLLRKQKALQIHSRKNQTS